MQKALVFFAFSLIIHFVKSDLTHPNSKFDSTTFRLLRSKTAVVRTPSAALGLLRILLGVLFLLMRSTLQAESSGWAMAYPKFIWIDTNTLRAVNTNQPPISIETTPQTTNETQWDCTISGSRNGLCLLTFSSDTNGGSFDGVELLVPKSVGPAKGANIHGLAGTLNTNGLGVGPGGNFGHTNLSYFGAFHIFGPWSFDRHGHITGSFLEVAPDRVSCTTNVVVISTNFDQGLTPVFATNLVDDTVCVTSPSFTNTVAGSYSNRMTCYINRVLISSNMFVSTTPISTTNVLPDGSYCETVPIFTNVISSNFTEQTVCYIDRVQISVNDFSSTNPVTATNVLPSGAFCETLPLTTNLVASTFTNRTVCFARLFNCSAVTNAVNFTGKMTPGERLTLNAKSAAGNFTISGVPAVAQADLSGEWSGTRKQYGSNVFELFDLAAVTNKPNSYLVNGDGPGYSYEGYALLSVKKKIALGLTIINGTSYQATRATIGSFNTNKLKSKTSGIEAPTSTGAPTNRLVFQIEKRITVP